MRFIMKVTLPVDNFNDAVRDGSAGAKIGRILEAIKPEAAYFTAQEGERGGILIVNLESASDIPALAEPWFLTFDAKVDFQVAMRPEDLAAAGLDELGKTWG